MTHTLSHRTHAYPNMPDLPDGYDLAFSWSDPEGWPRTYLNHTEGTSGLIVTGDRAGITVEIDYRDDDGKWRTQDISRMFSGFRTHESIVRFWIDAITAGEARESLAMEQVAACAKKGTPR